MRVMASCKDLEHSSTVTGVAISGGAMTSSMQCSRKLLSC